VQRENLNTVIEKINRYRQVKTLSVWDVDDTLYHTPPKELKVIIKHPETKKILETLTTREYADIHKKTPFYLEKHKVDRLEFDFSKFQDSDLFYSHAKPIQPNFNTAKQEYNDRSVFFIVLTARSNMDSKERFIKKFNSDGLNIKLSDIKSHILRMGSLSQNDKGSVLENILNRVTSNQLMAVKFWDDNRHERDTVEKISTKFPKILFTVTDAISGSSKKILDRKEQR
jgi:hypothetical protein